MACGFADAGSLRSFLFRTPFPTASSEVWRNFSHLRASSAARSVRSGDPRRLEANAKTASFCPRLKRAPVYIFFSPKIACSSRYVPKLKSPTIRLCSIVFLCACSSRANKRPRALRRRLGTSKCAGVAEPQSTDGTDQTMEKGGSLE